MLFLEGLKVEGATVAWIRCVEISRLAFWHDSRSSRRNIQVDPWQWNPEDIGLACFRVFDRLSFNGSSLSGNEEL
eukprot:1810343-Pyramimonas_sp.AAC.1